MVASTVTRSSSTQAQWRTIRTVARIRVADSSFRRQDAGDINHSVVQISHRIIRSRYQQSVIKIYYCCDPYCLRLIAVRCCAVPHGQVTLFDAETETRNSLCSSAQPPHLTCIVCELVTFCGSKSQPQEIVSAPRPGPSTRLPAILPVESRHFRDSDGAGRLRRERYF